MQKELLRRVAILALAGVVGACALSEDKVAIEPIQPEGTTIVAGAAAIRLEVKGDDHRQQYRDRISTKKNSYGMEMARIVATNDVVDVVRSGVERAFKDEGFSIGPGGLAVTIDLQNYYNNFKAGLMSGIAVAEVAFALKVRDAAGTLVYSQFYSATGTVDGVMLASGTNTKAALEKATTLAIKTVIDDQALKQALLATALPKKPVAGGRRPGA